MAPIFPPSLTTLAARWNIPGFRTYHLGFASDAYRTLANGFAHADIAGHVAVRLVREA